MTYFYTPVYDQFGAVDEPVDWELWQMRQDAREDMQQEHDEQIAWETLVADGHVIQVQHAAGVMADIIAAIEMGAHDDVPW